LKVSNSLAIKPGHLLVLNSYFISSNTDLQSTLQKANGAAERVTMRMKLLWVSSHTYNQFQLAKLHFIDEASPEPLDELLAVSLMPLHADDTVCITFMCVCLNYSSFVTPMMRTKTKSTQSC